MTTDIIPGIQLLCLTADDDNYDYQEEEDICCWIDDYECQENLGTILALGPEECVIDNENHIQSLNGVHLFFEELGVLTEEPEPIDPTRDYDEEARIFLQERNKQRKYHIESIPSLLDDDTHSAVSSTVSSFHEDIIQQNNTASKLSSNPPSIYQPIL